MIHPKLILLNGPAGIGKTTIAQRYIDEHPLALSISGDDIIVMLGQWLEHEAKAREIVFEFTREMARTHLRSGHDVVLPYLVAHVEHADAFQQLAEECGADYYEVLLTTDRTESVERMLERGTWGERGTDPLTEEDRSEVERLYDAVHGSVGERPHVLVVRSVKGDIDGTYRQLIEHISKA
jgi:predicted kinase